MGAAGPGEGTHGAGAGTAAAGSWFQRGGTSPAPPLTTHWDQFGFPVPSPKPKNQPGSTSRRHSSRLHRGFGKTPKHWSELLRSRCAFCPVGSASGALEEHTQLPGPRPPSAATAIDTAKERSPSALRFPAASPSQGTPGAAGGSKSRPSKSG